MIVVEFDFNTFLVAGSGSCLCVERSEERNTNREGVASGSATYFFRLLKVI